MYPKTAVITGASSGIGKATALEFARLGINVVLAARNEDALREVADECTKRGVEAYVFAADVRSPQKVDELAAMAVEQLGNIDVWINNAGVIYYGSFLDITPDEFKTVIDTNLMGYVYGSQAALRQFDEQGRGTLINVGSGFGAFPAPYASAYVASKYAVRGLSASLRQELFLAGQKDIHVCTVLPATIDTPVYHNAANKTGRVVQAIPPAFPVSTAVKAIRRLLAYPRPEVIAGYAAYGPALLYRLSPGIAEPVMAWYVNRFGYKEQSELESLGNLYEPRRDGAVSGRWPTWQARLGQAGIIALAAAGLYMRFKKGGKKGT